MVKIGVGRNAPTATACVGRVLNCMHFVVNPVLFVLIIAVVADHHWIRYERRTDMTHWKAACGLWGCKCHTEGGCGDSSIARDFSKDFVLVKCASLAQTRLCRGSKAASAFVIMALVCVILQLGWNVVVAIRCVFGKPSIFPAFWWQCMAICIDFGQSFWLGIAWVIFVAVDPFHEPAGEWTLDSDFAVCVVAFVMATANILLSCTQLLWQPMDDDAPFVKLWNY